MLEYDGLSFLDSCIETMSSGDDYLVEKHKDFMMWMKDDSSLKVSFLNISKSPKSRHFILSLIVLKYHLQNRWTELFKNSVEDIFFILMGIINQTSSHEVHSVLLCLEFLAQLYLIDDSLFSNFVINDVVVFSNFLEDVVRFKNNSFVVCRNRDKNGTNLAILAETALNYISKENDDTVNVSLLKNAIQLGDFLAPDTILNIMNHNLPKPQESSEIILLIPVIEVLDDYIRNLNDVNLKYQLSLELIECIFCLGIIWDAKSSISRKLESWNVERKIIFIFKFFDFNVV